MNTSVPIDAASPQVQWLRRELLGAPAGCALAFMHRPMFSSGPQGGDPSLRDLWQVLYEGGVDVVVAGDDHAYERFTPQNPEGRADLLGGIRQFVVGTGGAPLYQSAGAVPNSEVRNGDTWGVVRFTLGATGYAWEFVPVEGATFRDTGSASCH
jgi:hypothetical protein